MYRILPYCASRAFRIGFGQVVEETPMGLIPKWLERFLDWSFEKAYKEAMEQAAEGDLRLAQKMVKTLDTSPVAKRFTPVRRQWELREAAKGLFPKK
jgi:hypothetical protein